MRPTGARGAGGLRWADGPAAGAGTRHEKDPV